MSQANPVFKNMPLLIADSHKKQFIKILKTDGNKVELEKITQVLHDQQGVFAGGLGLLLPVSEQSANMSLPKDSSKAFAPRLRPVGEAPESEKPGFQGLLSRSPAMQAVFQIIQNAAETEATVLVRGESGSGKELVAKAIHDLSARRNAPFLAINCAALSSTSVGQRVVRPCARRVYRRDQGSQRRVSTRARRHAVSWMKSAELPLELQAKLLRVIQERNYIPVGGDHSIDVDVRIVAATHRSLREEVKNGAISRGLDVPAQSRADFYSAVTGAPGRYKLADLAFYPASIMPPISGKLTKSTRRPCGLCWTMRGRAMSGNCITWSNMLLRSAEAQPYAALNCRLSLGNYGIPCR